MSPKLSCKERYYLQTIHILKQFVPIVVLYEVRVVHCFQGKIDGAAETKYHLKNESALWPKRYSPISILWAH